MSDELKAFFAKKQQKKSKKKNVVSIDDMGQQLERRVRIQETGEPEIDENELKDVKANDTVTPNVEDSEWLEHTEKPSLVGLTFKEFTENPDEFLLEEEKKRANNESAKTWNLNTEPLMDVLVVSKPAVKSTYQAPSQRRQAPLDISNQEMFPSIAAADQIAEKLKVEEKKKGSIISAKPEDQFEEAKKSRPRFPASDGGNVGRSTPGGGGYRGDQRSGGGYDRGERSQTQRFGVNRSAGGGGRNVAAEDHEDGASWRNVSNNNVTSQSSAPTTHRNLAISQEDEPASWRSGRQAIVSTAVPTATRPAAKENQEAWRSNKPSVAQSATTLPTAGAQKKYVPPSLRNK